MKATTIIIFINILLFSILLTSAAAIEISGGMEIAASNGGAISGVSTPTSTSLCLGKDASFARDFNIGETQEFTALFANEDTTLGTAKAGRSSKPRSNAGDPSYALLSFKAPNTPMNILLLDANMPNSINFGEFKDSITQAGKTWNNNGVVSKTFFDTVTAAPSGTQALANDNKFVHSFMTVSDNWLAGNWLTWNRKGTLTDSDVIYNTKYTYDTGASTSYSYDPNNPIEIVDLEAIAVHELGHNIGLDDIYNKPSLSWDMSEVMNSYIWGQPRFSLGEGDKAGLAAKYGS